MSPTGPARMSSRELTAHPERVGTTRSKGNRAEPRTPAIKPVTKCQPNSSPGLEFRRVHRSARSVATKRDARGVDRNSVRSEGVKFHFWNYISMRCEKANPCLAPCIRSGGMPQTCQKTAWAELFEFSTAVAPDFDAERPCGLEANLAALRFSLAGHACAWCEICLGRQRP